MITSIVFSLLFLLPFVIAPFGITQFENPKVIIAEAGIILLFLITLFKKPEIFRKKNKVVILYGVLLLLTVIDLVFFKTTVSFFGNAFRMQGIFLLWLLLLFSFLSRNIALKRIPWYMIFSLLIALVVMTVLLPINESGRYVGVTGEPNATAAVVLFLWPFLWFSLKKNTWWEILVLAIGAGSVLVIFYLTGSKSALIGFILQIIFLILLRYKLSTQRAIIICLCLLAASFSLPFFQKNIPYENRAEVWTAGVDAGVRSPILGGGFGNTEILLQQSTMSQHLRVREYYVDSSHNIFLDWWVQGGIVGMSILLILIVIAFRQFAKTDNKRNTMLLLGILTALSFNPASIVGLLQFWWLIGSSQIEE